MAEKRAKEDRNEEIDSDDEPDEGHHDDGAAPPQFEFSDDDDADQQTPQDKRLQLAKKYLDEIEKEERARAEDKAVFRTVSHRLDQEYLDSVGKLRKKIADDLSGYEATGVQVLRSKLHKLPVTCVCVSADNRWLFTGSKTAFVVKWDLEALSAAVGSFDCGKTRLSGGVAEEEEAQQQQTTKGKAKARKAARPQVIALALSSDFKFLVIPCGSALFGGNVY